MSALLARLLGTWTTRLLRFRWGVGGLLLLLGVLGPRGPLLAPPDAVFLLGLAVLGYNAFFRFTAARGSLDQPEFLGSMPRLAFWQVTFDWIALIVLLFLTGGPINPIAFLFVFHVVLSAVYLPPRDCVTSGLVAAGLLLLGTVLTFLGVPLPRSVHWGGLAIPAGMTETAFFVVSLILGHSLAIWVTHLLGNRLWYEERTLSEANARLAEWRDRARILNQMSIDINRARGADLYHKTVEAATRVCNAPAASLRIDHEGRGVLELTASTGLSAAYLEKGPILVAESPLDQRVMSGELVTVPNILAEGLFQYPEEAAREGIHAVLAAPVAVGGKTLGVLRVYDRRERVFGDLAREFVTGLAGLAAVAVQNEKALASLETRDAMVREFTVSATHYLRSPLAATQNLLDLVLEGYTGEVGEKQAEILRRARFRIDHLLTLVRELLFFTTRDLESGRGQEESFDLADVVRGEADKAREMAEEKGLRFDLDVGDGNYAVHGIREEFVQVVANLAQNALSYTPPPGRVSVRLEDVVAGYLLVVQDTGIGIEPELQSQVFREFYRTPRARNLTELGTGLGLSMVKRVLDRMGGQVSLTSNPGKGTTFRVWFPNRIRAGAPAGGVPEAGPPP